MSHLLAPESCSSLSFVLVFVFPMFRVIIEVAIRFAVCHFSYFSSSVALVHFYFYFFFFPPFLTVPFLSPVYLPCSHSFQEAAAPDGCPYVVSKSQLQRLNSSDSARTGRSEEPRAPCETVCKMLHKGIWLLWCFLHRFS